MPVTSFGAAQNTQDSSGTSDYVDALGAYVYQKLTRAISTRAEITQRMINAAYAQRLKYTAGACPEGEPDTHTGIIAAKSRTVSAWLSSVMSSAVEQMWTLDPTTQPELPAAINDLIYQKLIAAAKDNGIDPAKLPNLQQALTDLAQKHTKEQAVTNTNRMAEVIRDMLDDAHFADQLSDFMDDLAKRPYAVMAGPELVARTEIVHDPDQPTGANVRVRTGVNVRRVDPKTFYWASNATNPRDGEFVIEYARVSGNALLDAVDSQMAGFIPEAIDRVIDSNRNFNYSLVPHDALLEQIDKDEGMNIVRDHGDYPCIKYHGLVTGSYLEDHGLVGVNRRRRYECEIWVVDGVVVRLLMNVNPMANRNFFVTSMYTEPGAMVGMGLCDVLWHLERICNASIRSMVKNMPFSAGPIGEYDMARLENPDDVDADGVLVVEPNRMYAVNPDPMGSGQNAFRFTHIPSNASEFMSIYERFDKEADAKSGIPAYLIGQLDIASMARTASGLSMLLQSASKVLQRVISNIDRDIMAPMIESMYNWVMLYHPDVSIKADVKVKAKGASGVLNRELGQAKLVDLLQLLQPYAQAGLVLPQSIMTILREVVKGTGYDADKIFPPGEDGKLAFMNAIATASGSLPPAPAELNAPAQGAGPTSASIPQGDGRFVQ